LTEEHSFLREICLNALSADKFVRFAAVVDNNGKLLCGEYKSSFLRKSTCIKSSIFYLHYLIPTITRQEDVSEETIYSDLFHYNLADFGETVSLAVVALTERKDRYLCIYLESFPTTSKASSHDEILSKIHEALC
jgi:hypothetical protein